MPAKKRRRLQNARLRALVSLVAIACVVIVVRNSSDGRSTLPLGLIPATQSELKATPGAERPVGGTFPIRVDSLVKFFPPAGQQGLQDSCAAWALAYVRTFEVAIKRRWTLSDAKGLTNDHFLSPAFIYNLSNRGFDGGVKIIDGLKLLRTKGVSTWSLMPYKENDWTSQPSFQAMVSAQSYKIVNYGTVDVHSLFDLKSQLSAGYPVVTGLPVDSSLRGLKRGQVWRDFKKPAIGDHAIVLAGYDDEKNAFKFLNSWGSDWADDGYGWIDYNLFTEIAHEGYVITETLDSDGAAKSQSQDVARVSGSETYQNSFTGLPQLAGGRLRVVSAHSNEHAGYVLYITYFGGGSLDVGVSLSGACENVQCPKILVAHRLLNGVSSTSSAQVRSHETLMPEIYAEDRHTNRAKFHWTIELRKAS